jgi:hypothetical protein
MGLRRLRAAAGLGVVLALPGLAATASALPAPGAPTVVTPGTGPVALALVVPLTVPADEGGLLAAETLAAITAPDGFLTLQLDELLAVREITIALDPLIPASIRILGSSAPATAREWLARLESSDNEVFLLAFADADLGALAAADALEIGVPLSLESALDPADFGPAITPTPTATPTESAEPDASPSPDSDSPDGDESTDPDAIPPLPNTADLLGWADALPGIAWPAPGTVTAAALDGFAAAGFTHLLLNSGDLTSAASGLAALGEVDALVADAGVSALLSSAVAGLSEGERAEALANLLSGLETVAAAAPGRTMIAALDRDGEAGTPHLSDVAASLSADLSVRLVPVSEVIGGPVVSAAVIDPTPDEERAGPIRALVEADARLDDFASILADPLLLTAPRRLEILSLLSLSWVDSGGREAAEGAFFERHREILSSVQVVDGSTLQVISSTANLRIAVSNALDFPVTVRVDARPLRPLIRIDGPVEVTIEPGSSKTAIVPAQAITDGQVPVQVTLSSPVNGSQVGAPQLLMVNLQAQLETVAAIFGGVVALVFVAGIIRNVVVRRRAATTRESDNGRDG